MKKNVITYSLTFMLMLFVGTLLMRCSDEEYASGASTNQICFGEAQMAEWLSSEGDDGKTRGSTITSVTSLKNAYKKYLVYAWAKPKDGDYMKYISGDSVTSSSGVISGTNYFWPSSDYAMRFLALAPTTLASSVNCDEKGISMDYTVPDEVTEQKDLLFALTDQPTRGDAVPLKFGHMLTSIRVKLSSGLKNVKGVESVSLKNVYGSGTMTYALDCDDGSFAWSNLSDKSTYTSTYRNGADLAAGTSIFMMIPQNFTGDDGNSDAEIVLNLTDGTSRSYKLADTGKNWKAGYSVTYTLSYTADVDVFDVPEYIDVTADDTYLKIPVLSRREATKNKKLVNTPLEWKIVGDVPSWLTSNSKISTEEGKDTLTFTTSETDSYVEGDRWLQEQPTKSGTVDLSDDCKNTANCYIINAAGTYKFPLVYGNAIKDGAANTQAYSGKYFYNHLGKTITSPYIYENAKCNVGSVELLWQDREGLITSVGLSDDNKYITFTTAGQSDIGQGNAVIAVRDNTASKNIMWSWHIWVTYYVPNKEPDFNDYWKDKEIIPRTAGTKDKYVIMPINLGWCDQCKYYKGRNGEVTIKQTATGKEKTVKIYQRPTIDGTNGSQPHYQWSRKDPFIPFDASGGFDQTEDAYIPYPDKAAYDINGKEVEIKTDVEKFNLQKTIRNPDVFMIYSTNYRMWGNGDTPWQYGYKTIYDPSPVGYRVAVIEALSVITTEDGSSFKLIDGKINTPFTKNEFVNKRYKEVHEANGWVFYCHPKVDGKVDPSGGTFFMPTSLFRQFLTKGVAALPGQVLFDNTSGHNYHGSGTVSVIVDNDTDGNAYNVAFMGGLVSCSTSTTYRLYGRAIRCMKE